VTQNQLRTSFARQQTVSRSLQDHIFSCLQNPASDGPATLGGGSLASPHLHSSWKKDGLAQCDSDREVGRLMELISIMRSGPRLWRERTSKLGHAVVTKRHKRSQSWPHMESCHDSEAHCTLSHVRCNLALVRCLGSRDIVTDLP
jgi:hypothetical protein